MRKLLGAISLLLGLGATVQAQAQSAVLHVPNNTQLAAASSALKVLTRDGVFAAGDAPPLQFVASGSACSLQGGAGDVGSQVPTRDGKCWIANFSGAPDAREWGVTYPFSMHVSSTGTDAAGANWCYGTGSSACATLQQAVTQACTLNFRGQTNFVRIDATFTGPGFSLSGECPGMGGNAISGQYLWVVGNGSANTTITAAAGPQIFAVEPSSGAHLEISNLTISVPSNTYAVFAQNSGTVVEVGDDVTLTGATGAVGGYYAEALALIELGAVNTRTVQGSFNNVFHANTGGYVEFDPAGTTVLTCGSGLAIPVGGGFLTATGGTLLWYAPTLTGCSGVTGDPIKAYGASTILYAAGTAAAPGNGSARIDVGSQLRALNGTAVYPPTLGTCANATINANSTNYDAEVDFTGANSTCQLLFGKAPNMASWFAVAPSCIVQGVPVAPNPVNLSARSATSLTAVPTVAFANGNALLIRCSPLVGG